MFISGFTTLLLQERSGFPATATTTCYCYASVDEKSYDLSRFLSGAAKGIETVGAAEERVGK